MVDEHTNLPDSDHYCKEAIALDAECSAVNMYGRFIQARVRLGRPPHLNLTAHIGNWRGGDDLGGYAAIGTRDWAAPSMRSKMSSRFGPVIVSPWFFWPIAARPGSGAAATRSATAFASSMVPQG